MTLRELLNEEHFIQRNYWVARNKEKSVISGKEILGFPSDRATIPISNDGIMFDVVNVGDHTYEFYVGDYRGTKGAPYKYKKCYIGTYKYDDLDDDTGIALALIRHFINNRKINDRYRKHLKDYYDRRRKHPYYKGAFEEL